MYLSATVFTLFEPITAKWRLFMGGTPLRRLRSRGTFAPSGTKFCHAKLETFGAAHSEDFMILACTVLIQLTSVTDGQTDRQTDAQTMAKTREAFCFRA